MIAFKELLVRAKRGEEKAFEELFEQFEPLVRKCSYMNGHALCCICQQQIVRGST